MANFSLKIDQLTMKFGGITALNNVSFKVLDKKITALIGPNGAGKTTLFNCITGFYRPTLGSIYFNSKNGEVDLQAVLGKKIELTDFIKINQLLVKVFYKIFGGKHKITRTGIARTFQNIRLFKEMTLIENLLVAHHTQINTNILAGIVQTANFKETEQKAVENSYFWLQYFGLESDMNKLAGELPYGKARMLEIARSMCTNPNLLCLDEPAAGLNPKETNEFSDKIIKLREEFDLSILLIEHDMSLVMKLSDLIVVLDHGTKIAQGNPTEIKNDKNVIAAYLGQETEY